MVNSAQSRSAHIHSYNPLFETPAIAIVESQQQSPQPQLHIRPLQFQESSARSILQPFLLSFVRRVRARPSSKLKSENPKTGEQHLLILLTGGPLCDQRSSNYFSKSSLSLVNPDSQINFVRSVVYVLLVFAAASRVFSCIFFFNDGDGGSPVQTPSPLPF